MKSGINGIPGRLFKLRSCYTATLDACFFLVQC